MAVKALLRRLALVAVCLIGDLLLAFVLGPKLWPAPLAFIYKLLDSFNFKISRNTSYSLSLYLYIRSLVPIIPFNLAPAGWFWHLSLFCLLYFCGFNIWSSVSTAIGLLSLPDWRKRVRFLGALAALEQRDPLSPAALGTLFVHTACFSSDDGLAEVAGSVACEAFIVWSVCWLWTVLQLRVRSTDGRTLKDRLSVLPFIRQLITRERLSHAVSWVVWGLSSKKPEIARHAHAWIAKRVEEETLKTTEHHLDNYVRADMLKQTPTFETNVTDTEDIDFLSLEKCDADPQNRPLVDVFVKFIFQDEHINGMLRLDALSVLAHLSFLKDLNLDPASQQRLGRELLCLCRVMLDDDKDYKKECLRPVLEATLIGLANLARGNAEIGSLLKSERLFSIIVALVNPFASLSDSFTLWGDHEVVELKQAFEDRDPGYSQSDLTQARIERRASVRREDPARRPLAALPSMFDISEWLFKKAGSATSTALTELTYCRVNCFGVNCFGGHRRLWGLKKVALLHKFQAGVWYRLLTLGVRLISSLSTVESNHVWLLKQGALQALHRMLQLLPTDRMRSGQQEAALFIYRIFENQTVRALIHKSSALKATAGEIVLKLRAIDSDLFGDGWSHRIGRPLYDELVSGASSTADAKATNSKEPTSDTTEGQHLPSSKRCSREGCQAVERRYGVRLKKCAGCLQVRYCSRECQKADYSSHNLVCKL